MSCKNNDCPLFDSCRYIDPSECDLAVFFKAEKTQENWAPLYVRFTYRDEWRHVPIEENYPIWTVDDFGTAMRIFRERHESQGTLIAFITEDTIEWKMLGETSKIIDE